MMPSVDLPQDARDTRPPDGRVLTGQLATWHELQPAMVERLGLTVVVADPRSGTSALLQAAVDEAGGGVVVDARRCSSPRQLALAIADAAIAMHVPDAVAWWMGTGPPAGTSGLELYRALREQSIPFERVRDLDGETAEFAGIAVDIAAAAALLDETLPRLVIDHLGVMLANMRAAPARELLATLRTARQHHAKLDLWLVDHPDGPIQRALHDEHHPLWRAGAQVRITRPAPERFTTDLAITRPLVTGPAQMIGAAAELAAGVPALTWRIVELAHDGDDDVTRAITGWRRLQELTFPIVAQQWEMLRRVHSSAADLVTAISLGLPPHSIDRAAKSVDDGLGRLRDLGLAWQPATRQWAVADPLLASYARTHAPPWTRRRRVQATNRL